MKKLKFILLGLAGLSLFACNSGGTSSNDVQNKETSGGVTPNFYKLSYSATGCQTISGTGSTCSVQINYGGTGTYAGITPTITGLNGYTTNISTQCIQISSDTTYANNPCYVTITNTGVSSSNAQTATINLNDQKISFIVGGGL